VSLELNHTAPVNLSVVSPISSQEQFAGFVGVTVDTVRGWVEKGVVPTVKVGKRRFINNQEFSSQLKSGKTIFSASEDD
jgi:excisionase family DNA binding protein